MIGETLTQVQIKPEEGVPKQIKVGPGFVELREDDLTR